MKEIKEEKRKNKMIKYLIIIFIIVGIISLLWARFISTRGLLVKEFKVESEHLPEDYNGLKIVQFTDLHYGSTIQLKELKNVVDTINKQNPDIIVFTGDLVEEGVVLSDDEIKEIIAELNRLNPVIESLAVIGNHDYDHDYWNLIMPNTNFKILDNTYEYVYYNSKTPIVFVGFDDLLEGKPDYKNGFSYLNETSEDLYTIILIHEPDQIDQIKDYQYDLVLAGHSHLGQARLPFIGALWTPIGSKKYYDEHYIVGNADLYISGGIGTSALKLRFLAKPSITLYRFYTK